MNDLQRLLAFMLIFIAIVIHLCDRVDFGRVNFGVSRLKSVV